MADDSEAEIVTKIDGKVVVANQGYTVVTQGDTETKAWEMLDEAETLYFEGGRQVDSIELMHDFGLSTKALNTNPLPTDFSEYSPPESFLSPITIASTLMAHGFRPLSRTDNHLQLVSITGPCDISVIIPMTEDYLDSFVSGFIAGTISDEDVEPNNVMGWFEEN